MTPSTNSFLATLQSMSAGQWLDVLFGGILLWCVARGASRGLMREVLRLLAVVAAFGIAGAFYRAAHAGSGIEFGLPVPGLAMMAWYVVLWFGAWMGARLIGWGVLKMSRRREEGVDPEKPTWSGRASGALFGSLKAGAIVGFFAFTLAAFDTKAMPFGDKIEGVIGQSRTIKFARDHPELLGYVQQSNVMARLNDSLLDLGADQVLSLCGLEDSAARAEASKLAGPLLAEPELVQHLGASPKARELFAALSATEAYRGFAADSLELKAAADKPQLDLKDLLDIIRAPAASELLQDPEILAVLHATDFAAITAELRASANAGKADQDTVVSSD